MAILGVDALRTLRDAGLVDDDTRRVVLDIPADRPVVAYIERYADTRVLNVVTSLEGVRIEREDKE